MITIYEDDAEDPDGINNKIYDCIDCNKVFTSNQKLIAHLRNNEYCNLMYDMRKRTLSLWYKPVIMRADPASEISWVAPRRKALGEYSWALSKRRSPMRAF